LAAHAVLDAVAQVHEPFECFGFLIQGKTFKALADLPTLKN
jgi:hypothetical protein